MASTAPVEVDLKEHIIDEEGDVYLVVEEAVKLRVSTKMLSMASTVFRAMFSRTYAEGRKGFSASRPKTIELPEDDAMAMLTICNLIHFRPLKTGTE